MLKYHKGKALVSTIILASIIAITLSTFVLVSLIGVNGLSKHEGAKLWLFASWCLFTLAILVGLVVALMEPVEKKEAMPAPAAPGEDAPEAMMVKPASSMDMSRLLSLITAALFGGGVLTMVIFLSYMVLTKLPLGTGV